MKRLGGSACGLLLVALAAACGNTHQARDSNSNWLRACADRESCGDGGSICACGVCTVACVEDEGCQRAGADEATCVSVAEAHCAGASARSRAAVCAFSCERDAQCEDGLSCVRGACVRTASRPPSDGGSGRDGAQGTLDAAVAGDAAVTRGPGARDAAGDGVASGPAEAGQDATVIDSATVAESATVADSAVGELFPAMPPPTNHSISCLASNCFGLPCAHRGCQRSWNGQGCSPAAPLAERPECAADGGCPRGLLCHADGTCIEPGKCDQFGESTLAIVGDVRELFVTAGGVYLLKANSDPLGNPPGDSAITRVPIDGGAVETVVAGIGEPWQLLVDESRVFWVQAAGGTLSLWRAERSGANRAQFGLAGNLLWAQNGADLYFVSEPPEALADGLGADDTLSFLYRYGKSSQQTERLSDESAARIFELAVDSQRVYAGDLTLPVASGVAGCGTSMNATHFFAGRGDSASSTVLAISKADGSERVLAQPSGLIDPYVRAYRDHVYYPVELARPANFDPTKPITYQLYRSPVTPGESQWLVRFERIINHAWRAFDVSDRGLFFIEAGRLMRIVIADYTALDGQSPAQGTQGGPCFSDLGCGAGLTCVDCACQ